MPKITVIIPAYNSMPYIMETLENLFQQTYQDFEVIVVNDGSTDKTQEYVSSLNEPRLRLINQTNQGCAVARNTGIYHAKGEYIAFLDDDDLWDTSKLEKQLHCIEQNPEIGLVYTWVEYIDERGKFTGKVYKDSVEGDVWQELTAHNLVECGSVPLVRRSCFETCGVFDASLGSAIEDWDMWLRIANSHHFGVVKEILVYYRQREASASKDWDAMAKGFQVVIEKAFASAPVNMQYLKEQSYGFANLCLAWKPLQCQQKNPEQAFFFAKEAVRHHPKLRFSREYLRLNMAIALMQFLKPEGYAKVKPFLYALRRLKFQ